MGDKLTIKQVRQWQQDAVADGWSIEPTYGDFEDMNEAGRLQREGFIAQTLARPAGTIPKGMLNDPRAERLGSEWVENSRRRVDDCSIAIWGPDGLAIPPVVPYDFAAIQAALTICSECGAKGETVRIGFAGRVCPSCRVKLAPTVECRGWCD